MVNTIDQQRRRTLLANAVWRLVQRNGLQAASVRAVAAEAGLSAGSVRHFFSSQAALHVFAMQTLVERISTRITAHQTIDDLPTRAVAMVCELMPLTDESDAELRAWLEFVAASQTDPSLATVATGSLIATREFLTKVVSDQVELGLIPAETDIGRTVVELNALIDGLTFDLIHCPELVDRATARSLVAHRLAHPSTKGRSS